MPNNSDYVYNPKACTLCPRNCRADRTVRPGACGTGNGMQIARVMLHRFEEPPLSGTRGSGAIFFRGCNLRCGYCQNAKISHGVQNGAIVSPDQLANTMLTLQARGAHNIDLITAAHVLPYAANALRLVKPQLHIPVVYNSSGYEKAEALKLLDGLVDVYLPDFKYADPAAAGRYSGAEDYPAVARAAIAEMVRQTGAYAEKDGIVQRGTIIRHLVLPGLSQDGVRIMDCIAQNFPAARISIMRQYTPSFNRTGDPVLNRKVTSYEYNRVVDAAVRGGLQGFTQQKDSATSEYTPEF